MIQRHIYDTEDRWLDGRKGLFTASRISELLTKPRKGYNKYVLEKFAEIIAPNEPNFTTNDMQRGKDLEPQAVLKYAEIRGLDINADDFIYTSIGGFVFFTELDYNIGGTPDIILSDRICEIKCPKTKQHLEYMLVKDWRELPTEYICQMQINMYLCEREKCDFITFDDRVYDNRHMIKIIEVDRDEEIINNILQAAKKGAEIIKQLNLEI